MGIIRDSFVMFKNWSDAIDALPEEYQLETYKAVSKYGLTGEMPSDISPIAKAILISFSRGMENNIARYNASVENGKKGGRPPKEKQEESQQPDVKNNNLQKPNITQYNLSKPNHNLNVNVNDNVNGNVNVNDNVSEQENSLTRVKESEETSPLTQNVVPEKKPKHKFGEYQNVLLTDDEYSKLIAMEDGSAAIEHLSYHREMKGYKCKSDYLAIRKWVFTALKEERQRQDKLNGNSSFQKTKKESPMEQLSRVFGGE